MSIYSSKRRSKKPSTSHLGHLKLSVIEEASALVVHVFEARGLQRKDGGSFNTYIKIYLLPDPHKQTKEKTRTVKEKDPIFNQKFSFILGEGDQNKQLFISVWTQQVASRNDMIGCMTFSIADLLGSNQGLNGWYQVLDEVRGRTENLPVPTSISKRDTSMEKYDSSALLRGQKMFTVTVMKSSRGYGFSVSMHTPVHITEVTKGLPAANADLRVGDVILEIQGNDVQAATGEDVVAIVQNSPGTVHMILQRDLAGPQHMLGSSSRQNKHHFNSLSRSSRSKSSLSITHASLGSPEGGPPPKQLTPQKRHSMQYSSHSQLMPEYHTNPYLHPAPPPPVKSSPKRPAGGPNFVEHYATLTRPRRPRSTIHGILSQPDISHMHMHGGEGGRPPTDMLGGHVGGSAVYPAGMNRGAVQYGSAVVKNTSSHRRMARKKSVANDGRDGAGQFMGGALSQPSDLPMDFYSGRGGGSLRHPTPLRHPPPPPRPTAFSMSQEDFLAPSPRTTPPTGPRARGHRGAAVVTDGGMVTGGDEQGTDEATVDWEALTPQEQKRQKLIQNVVSAEMCLCSELKAGMETYVEPLKHVLVKDSHRKIFLGIVEMLSFSMEFCEGFASRRKTYTMSSSAPTAHYLDAIADIYASKLNDMVANLKAYSQNCQAARQEIALSFTNEGFTKLVQEAVQGNGNPSIYAVVEAGKEYLQKLTKWMMSLLYLTPTTHPDQKHLQGIVEALVPFSTDKELQQKWVKDCEVMKTKQLCVGFGSRVTPFHLQVPGRALIYEGEVSIKKKKLWLMLFSDIVLLTQRRGKIFTCIENPIMLDNLTLSDINCSEPTDFQLVVVEGTLNRLIRAPSVAAREEWVGHLKERASGTLANKKKGGDKIRSQHLYEAMRKHPHLLLATLAVDSEVEMTSHNPMSTIPESASEKTKTETFPEANHTLPEDGPLKRGISKRRSLISPQVLKEWEVSFSALLKHPDGLELFEDFLVSEFSEENIQFWKACEHYRTVPDHMLEKEATIIYEEYIAPQAPKLVNIDHQTTREIVDNMKVPNRSSFSRAQQSIYLLMARDSFVRFVKSEQFQSAFKRNKH